MNKYHNHIAVFFMILLLASGCGDNDAPVTVLPGDPAPLPEVIPPVDTTTVKDGTVVETALLVSLGEKLFNDTDLSANGTQSCASCHTAAVGFDDPDNADATSLGDDGASIGTRNAPTASYAAHIPDSQIILRSPPGGGPAVLTLIGGQFLDGRAESLEEQAKGPFLNPVEMNIANETAVIDIVKLATYAADFEALFGANILDNVTASYNYIADAIAAFERSPVFSPFTSKFDQVQNGTAVFTAAEARGQMLFNTKAQCNLCHITPPGTPQVFSNFGYFNIGVPANATLLINLGDPMFVDNGLGDVTLDALDDGRFRVPNLRNIANTAPYMHNGVFSTLLEVVAFYNSRDLPTAVMPEVSDNVNNDGNIGNLGLTAGEMNDLVAFMEAMTD